MEATKVLLDHYYKIMWCEFSNKDVMSDDEIIHFIGVTGLNSLHDYGRLKVCGKENGHKLYMLDKNYIWH